MSRSTEVRLSCVVAALALLATLLVAPSASAAPGDLDLTFGGGDGIVTTDFGSSQETANAVSIAPDGDLVVAGASGTAASLVRYLPDGSLDPSFGTGGTVTTSASMFTQFSDVLHQPDGKILAGGSTGGVAPCFPAICFFSSFFLARYTTDGTLDASFGTGGVVETWFLTPFSGIEEIVLDGSGNIVVGGLTGDSDSSSNNAFALARYDTAGALDPTFGTGGTVTTTFPDGAASAHSLAIQGDGKIVAAGEADGGQVTTDASRDSDIANSVVLQPDGKIVIGGELAAAFALVRYADDGVIDPSFGTAGMVTTSFSPGVDSAESIALDSDGRILAGGSATDGTSDFALTRYTTDGSLDPSFGVGGMVTTSIGPSDDGGNDLEIDASGRPVLVGSSNNGSDDDYALVRYEGSAPEPPPIPTYEVHVKKAGTGSGTVSSGELGIDCGTDCASRLDKDTLGTLTAVPDEGSEFTGWDGPCLGDASDECSIEVTSPITVTATFEALDPDEHARRLEVTRFGHGSNGALVARGSVTVPDGFTACAASQEVVLQRRKADRTWVDKSAATTGPEGNFRLVAPDRAGVYRVVAAESEVPPTDVCGLARKRLSHRH